MKITSSWRLPLLLSASFALLTACSAATAEGGASAGASANAEGRTSSVRRANVLTREEIQNSGATNLYDAVNRLRPAWLRANASGQSSYSGGGLQVMVYQGSTQLGTAEHLRQLAPGYAASLRFLDGNTASNTLPGLGSRMVAGAIIIELQRN